MADLNLVLSEWPGAIPSDEIPTSLFFPSNEIFIGCRSGHIYCIPRASTTVTLRMILCIPGNAGIVGLASSCHRVDQPPGANPTLISLDTNGNLCSWDLLDGRCVMHNSTGLKPHIFLQVSSHLLLTETIKPLLHVFQADTLELMQTVELEAPVSQLIETGDGLACLLIDGSLWRLEFDRRDGRIGSAPEKFEHELPKAKNIGFMDGTLAVSFDDQIVFFDSNGRKTVKFYHRFELFQLLSSDRFIAWSSNGLIYDCNVYSSNFKALKSGSSEIIAGCMGIGAFRLITSDFSLLEFAVINEKLSMATQHLPIAKRDITADYISEDMNQILLGTANGQVLFTGLPQFYLSDVLDAPVLFNSSNEVEITAILGLGEVVVAGKKTGRTIFWDKSGSKKLLETRNHSEAIVSLFTVQRKNAEVFCVCQDGSVSVYETVPIPRTRRVIMRRPGLTIVSIRWASTLDDFILIEYSDGSCHVWNLNSCSFEKEQSSGSAQFNEVLALFSNSKYLGKTSEFVPHVVLDVRRCIQADSKPLMSMLVALLSSKLVEGTKTKVRRTLCWGVHGAGGCYALHDPSTDLGALSPVVSASMYLSLFALSRSVGDHASCINGPCLPSLSSLSKFWIDPDESIQSSSRTLVDLVIERLSKAEMEGFIQYWLNFLPNYSSGTKSMNRSAVILGIMALKNPSLLSEDIQKCIAQSLVAQLAGDKRNLFRTAAIEILGLGYLVFRPYFQPQPIFKALFSWLVSVDQQVDSSVEAEERTVDPRLIGAIKVTEQTLVNFVKHEKYAILPFWLNELLVTKSPIERIQGVALITEILKNSPLILEDYVGLIIDYLVRMLDPGAPAMRSATAPQISSLLVDFVKSFAHVRLHAETQKLIVGSIKDDGIIYLYDLRTATKVHTFEGLTKAVTALAFSADGKHICAYSFDEATVRIWNVPTGLMGILGTAHKPQKTLVVDPDVTETVIRMKENIDVYGQLVNLEWSDHDELTFSFFDGSIIQYSLA